MTDVAPAAAAREILLRQAGQLAGEISSQAMTQMCDVTSRLLGHHARGFDIEDPVLTDAADDEWPIILVRKSDGARMAVDIEVFVTVLGPLIDDQQPSPALMASRRPRSSSTALVVRDEECVTCHYQLVVGWVAIPIVPVRGAPVVLHRHADCEHLATMRATHPERFPDTAGQQALVPAESDA